MFSKISKKEKNAGCAVDNTISTLNTTIAILKEIGEALSNIPYVKAAAGITLQIIKIRDVCMVALAMITTKTSVGTNGKRQPHEGVDR
jgi:hypothetical protein